MTLPLSTRTVSYPLFLGARTRTGILESPEDFESSEDVFDAVGGVMLESAEEVGEEERVRELCDKLFAIMRG